MAIPGMKIISIGEPDKIAGSDSLYTAFHKINYNFEQVFGGASAFDTFIAGPGIAIETNANIGTVLIQNTGVTELLAGSGVTLSSNVGQITISSTGGGGTGNVSSVGITSNTLLVTNSPITGSGNIQLELPDPLTLSNVNSNSVNATTSIGIGNTSIRWSTVTTNSTTPAVLINMSTANITGVECFIKCVDELSSKRSVFKTISVTDGIVTEFVNYGEVHLSGGTGKIDIDVVSGNLIVQCWPVDSNPRTWTTQYSVI
jgi:hypothetical protein